MKKLTTEESVQSTLYNCGTFKRINCVRDDGDGVKVLTEAC